MANVTFKSTYLPALLAEIARAYFNGERALPTPESLVGFSFGESILTINATLPVSVSGVTATGNVTVAFGDRLPLLEPVMTGTAMTDITVDSLAEALFNVAVKLDAAETAFIAGGDSLPSGVDCTYSINNGNATITASLPYTVALDANGNQVLTITDYLA